MNSTNKTTAVILCLFGAALVLVGQAGAQSPLPGDAVRGAALYDAWYNVLDTLPPDYDQPLWATQESDKRSGVITWRCESCHGWDYKGVEGAAAPGAPNYTGFPGVRGMVGASEQDVLAWLDGSNNPDHDFSPYLKQASLDDITAFLLTRQVDLALLVNYQTKSAMGNWEHGRKLYSRNCLECHRPETDPLQPTNTTTTALAELALSDPWMVVHKVRFGHPASKMPAFEAQGWTLQDVADVVAFMQKLPPSEEYTSEIEAQSQGSQFDNSRQGETGGIIIGAAVIVIIIFGGMLWDNRKK